MLAACQQAMDRAARVGSRIMPDAGAFAACPADSIDYAVMEKADRVAVVPVSMGWSDVGSWDALHLLSECDGAGNAHRGTVLSIDRSEEHKSELQSLMRISYAVFWLTNKK